MESMRDPEIESVLAPSHIVILHEKLQKRTEDRYLVNLAGAFQYNNHKVTIVTSQFVDDSCLEELDLAVDNIDVVYSAWWVPQSFLGLFRKAFSVMKAAVMALRVVFFPPPPKPVIVVLDTNPIAILLIKYLSSYSVFFVENFALMKELNTFAPSMKMTPSLFAARWLKHANEIIVPTDCLAEIFRRSYPKVRKEVHTFYQCTDLGLWLEDCIDINRIIPDLPDNHILFSVFGKYMKRSNFRLIVEAFENLLLVLDEENKLRVHLVFAGYARNIEEKLYYNDIIESTKEKSFANQITFLRQLPVVHKKTIISVSAAVLHPAKYDVFAGPIIAAMNLGTLVIATNTGTAAKVISHRLTGILVEPTPQKFAAAMNKVVIKPALREFIRDMAADVFRKQYSFDSFTRRLKQLTVRYEVKSKMANSSVCKIE